MKNFLLTGLAMAILVPQLKTGSVYVGIAEIILAINFVLEAKKFSNT